MDTCAACGKASDSLMKCKACKLVVYCNRECQATNWQIHKVDCKKNRPSKPGKKGKADYAPDTSDFGPSPSPAAVADFWTWFLDNELALRHPDLWASPAGNMEVMRRVGGALEKVHPDITYEFGRSGTRYHVVIATAGKKELFNVVLSLIQAAPHLGHWRFTAFRPRETRKHGAYAFHGGTYTPDKIKFMLTEDDRIDKVGLILFMEGFDGKYDDLPPAEKRFYGQAAFLYLDSILGEYDVVMHVGGINFLSVNEGGMKLERTEGGIQFVGYTMDPLENLPRMFDERLSKKIGPKPEGGWAALAGLSLEVLGSAEAKIPAAVSSSPATTTVQQSNAAGFSFEPPINCSAEQSAPSTFSFGGPAADSSTFVFGSSEAKEGSQ